MNSSNLKLGKAFRFGQPSGVKRMLTDIARQLRRNRTLAEHILWRELRYRQCAGCKFRFQHAIPPYVVDLVCLERQLIVEVDGGQHNEGVDAARTEYLESKGFRVLRFWNNDILENLEGVFQIIEKALCGNEIAGFAPHANPPPKGGRE
ncbi:MAG: endonuclease domain-containing protein [Gammaproteobacteria bacterium]|nr:endonuclease domain-containing protein [Gammaproteobacteria bacterium]